ncbi:hypothetical protein COE78_26750 [Bacillus pseudomycoides]|nr:hypothetical protein COE78_26750 [Bacillus pseudomycoides]PHC64326.1 hypothetical protein COF38_29765 [Bacillus pseudomycoides]
MRGNSHVRCEVGEKVKITSNPYLSLFGTGFFDFIAKNGGKYTKELAIQFSAETYQKVKHTGMYRCVRPEMIPYGACYGDAVRP